MRLTLEARGMKKTERQNFKSRLNNSRLSRKRKKSVINNKDYRLKKQLLRKSLKRKDPVGVAEAEAEAVEVDVATMEDTKKIDHARWDVDQEQPTKTFTAPAQSSKLMTTTMHTMQHLHDPNQRRLNKSRPTWR